jgi:hypothetical protein
MFDLLMRDIRTPAAAGVTSRFLTLSGQGTLRFVPSL